MTAISAEARSRLWHQPAKLRLLTLAGLLVGFALRLYRLGAESLWYDETVSVALAQKNIPALLRHTAGDIHPPGYYLLLHFWQALTHPTPAFGLEFLYAWPSLCCGLLIVALVMALGRKLYTPQLAVVALWLAAINPYHIWYSQEVRMYTLGALLGLLCLWALLQWWQGATGMAQRYGWLFIYVIAAAAGLYTLYYFLFTLVTLNGIALLLWARHRRQGRLRLLVQWIAAQLAVILLWAPWLPVFWRQATDPPVPPWRTPWATGAQLIASLAESSSALISGQSAPNALTWYWLLPFLAILLIANYHYAKLNHPSPTYTILAAYVLVPIGLIYAITDWLTPLYHVRYLFTYAPPLLILLAAAILALHKRQRNLGRVIVIGLLLLNGWSLYRFWFTPAFQSDDHRAAVAQIAQAWRPGDAILVNAGWVYTALTTYWPIDLVGVDAALPPPLPHVDRLIDYRPPQDRSLAAAPLGPTVVRTGSVDGAPGLGWGDPSSDFFAMRALATDKALLSLAQHFGRIWHYRLYDTVNDPTGLIRTWLGDHTSLLTETPIPGRDYLRVELYQTKQAPTTPNGLTELALPAHRFAGDLQLQQVALSSQTVVAGEYLYANLVWQPPTDRRQLPAVVSFSLRLYSAAGHLLAQADETPLPIQAWPAAYAFTLALPIAVATPPGTYNLRLIAYDQQTGEPLTVLATEPPQQALPLGQVQVAVATRAPIVGAVQASFAYIDLVRARLTTPTSRADQPLAVELVWRPRVNDYRDTYLAQLALVNPAGSVVGQWEDALGGWDYPSGTWPPLIPVRNWHTLPIDPAIAPGRYMLTLRVLRNRDGALVPARQAGWRSWWPTQTDSIVVGMVEIE